MIRSKINFSGGVLCTGNFGHVHKMYRKIHRGKKSTFFVLRNFASRVVSLSSVRRDEADDTKFSEKIFE